MSNSESTKNATNSSDNFDPDEKLYLVPEVAAIFRVTVSCVRGWIQRGEIVVRKVGRLVRVPESSIKARIRTKPIKRHRQVDDPNIDF